MNAPISLSFFRRCLPGMKALALGAMGLLIAGAAWGQGEPTSITTNWNKSPAGDTLWMNSIFKVTSPVTNGETLFFDNVKASFPVNGGANTSVVLPNAEIIFSSNFSTESTTFNSATNTWITDVPLTDAGKNIFLTGGEYVVPAGGLNNISGNKVSLSGEFSSNKASSIQWQWGTAAYNTFSSDLNALHVQVVDGNGLHAGTPDAFDNPAYVDQGGSGGGASNFTGSYSGTVACNPTVVVPEPSSALLLCLGAMVMVGRARKNRQRA